MANCCDVDIRMEFKDEDSCRAYIEEIGANIKEAASKGLGADIKTDRYLFDGGILQEGRTAGIYGWVKWSMTDHDFLKMCRAAGDSLKSAECLECEESCCIYGSMNWNPEDGTMTSKFLTFDEWPNPVEGVDTDENGNVKDSWYAHQRELLEQALERSDNVQTMDAEEIEINQAVYEAYIADARAGLH